MICRTRVYSKHFVLILRDFTAYLVCFLDSMSSVCLIRPGGRTARAYSGWQAKGLSTSNI